MGQKVPDAGDLIEFKSYFLRPFRCRGIWITSRPGVFHPVSDSFSFVERAEKVGGKKTDELTDEETSSGGEEGGFRATSRPEKRLEWHFFLKAHSSI